MIGLLKGTVEHVTTNPILVVVGGVGYNVYVPDSLRGKLTKQEILFIHTHVTDDAITLFGFAKEEDLMLFELLLTVSGIGPKTALAIIDRGSQYVRGAINKNDVDFFTMIPRLGKKNAQKIIIELRNKLGAITELDLAAGDGETKPIRQALESMGFGREEIMEALKNVGGTTVEEKIREALKYLGKP
ncbi:Holliday junction DNA helicase RuvA [Candidatus Gottesmanbacteria bacterium RIFCSPHIGHO2_01_FULL_46_14]|uniref:Holliday junction branch migration complex subunit RuvA n=1 Tax=Candidatus Gottesmanbacteria bacterium RIFCSPHIGHO2_01_FULL_46_14 TaxID=1798380 RepID=A0A1F5ZQF2_9BACT|nr:MAG: Holliday junction DNA helicase RuvA [Candidatus Gottesmanbacteria bacterium RIFCSPHIGHO2_01_FULL_46_14]